jgi:hypothetical protein
MHWLRSASTRSTRSLSGSGGGRTRMAVDALGHQVDAAVGRFQQQGHWDVRA